MLLRCRSVIEMGIGSLQSDMIMSSTQAMNPTRLFYEQSIGRTHADLYTISLRELVAKTT